MQAYKPECPMCRTKITKMPKVNVALRKKVETEEQKQNRLAREEAARLKKKAEAARYQKMFKGKGGVGASMAVDKLFTRYSATDILKMLPVPAPREDEKTNQRILRDMCESVDMSVENFVFMVDCLMQGKIVFHGFPEDHLNAIRKVDRVMLKKLLTNSVDAMRENTKADKHEKQIAALDNINNKMDSAGVLTKVRENFREHKLIDVPAQVTDDAPVYQDQFRAAPVPGRVEPDEKGGCGNCSIQ